MPWNKCSTHNADTIGEESTSVTEFVFVFFTAFNVVVNDFSEDWTYSCHLGHFFVNSTVYDETKQTVAAKQVSYLAAHLYKHSCERCKCVHSSHNSTKAHCPEQHDNCPAACAFKTCLNQGCYVCRGCDCACDCTKDGCSNNTGCETDDCVNLHNCHYDNKDNRNKHINRNTCLYLLKQSDYCRSFNHKCFPCFLWNTGDDICCVAHNIWQTHHFACYKCKHCGNDNAKD